MANPFFSPLLFFWLLLLLSDLFPQEMALWSFWNWLTYTIRSSRKPDDRIFPVRCWANIWGVLRERKSLSQPISRLMEGHRKVTVKMERERNTEREKGIAVARILQRLHHHQFFFFFFLFFPLLFLLENPPQKHYNIKGDERPK